MATSVAVAEDVARAQDDDDVWRFGRETNRSPPRIFVEPGGHPLCPRHQVVLEETLEAMKTIKLRQGFRKTASTNLKRWKSQRAGGLSGTQRQRMRVIMRQGDWGSVTAELTEEYGEIFAVLNMANARFPGGGGGYMEGTLAQEENMFRRSPFLNNVQRGGYLLYITTFSTFWRVSPQHVH